MATRKSNTGDTSNNKFICAKLLPNGKWIEKICYSERETKQFFRSKKVPSVITKNTSNCDSGDAIHWQSDRSEI